MSIRIEPSELNPVHLMTLARVAEYGSLTRAAEALGITQPSVSQQMRELERVCGLPVIVQRGRSIAVTAVGEELAEIGRRIALERARASRIAERHKAGEAGSIVIGASMTTGTYVLPAVVARFFREHPDVRVDVRMGNTSDVAQMVIDDLADVGVVEGPLALPEIAVEPFVRDPLVCVAREGRIVPPRITRESALKETLLVREEGSATRQEVLDALTHAGIVFGRSMLFGTTQAIHEAVRRGVGVAWMPEIAVERDVREKVLAIVDVEDVAVERMFSVIRRRDGALSPAAASFVTLLRG